MAKLTLKQAWNNIKAQIVKPHIRTEAFLFLSAVIFTFAMLMATIVNFLDPNVGPLKWFTLSYFVAMFILEVVEFIVFSKVKYPKLWPFVVLTFALPFCLKTRTVDLVKLYTENVPLQYAEELRKE